jgi:hypothetical protein
MTCSAYIQYCLLLKSNNNINLFFDFIFLHLAAENLASWLYCPAWWYFFLMAILGGWGLDRLPFRRLFKLIAATQGSFK